MPILWRYLLVHYFKVLFFCTIAFIIILFTMRLDEIAHFITLGASGLYLLLFTLYQIPYILPIAIPISSLISTILLIQRLSKDHELTALRASAIAIRSILAPILLAAAFLSVLNFYIVSEIATSSHLASGVLKTELRSINPLLILNNKHLMHSKGYHFDILGSSQQG
jgi:lipopolysaccharide export system permease protein